MVKLNRIPQSEGAVATVVAKLESCEPCSSGAHSLRLAEALSGLLQGRAVLRQAEALVPCQHKLAAV